MCAVPCFVCSPFPVVSIVAVALVTLFIGLFWLLPSAGTCSQILLFVSDRDDPRHMEGYRIGWYSFIRLVLF